MNYMPTITLTVNTDAGGGSNPPPVTPPPTTTTPWAAIAVIGAVILGIALIPGRKQSAKK